MDALLLVVGLVGLWLGSQLAVRGALNVSSYLRIAPAVVGLVILSIGTDLPELMISVAGGWTQSTGTYASGVVLGNAIGSVLGQSTLVLGIVAWLGPLVIAKGRGLRDGLLMLASMVVFLGFSLDGSISRVEGIILCGLYAAYLFAVLRMGRKNGEAWDGHRDTWFGTLVSLAGGLALVAYASSVTVESAMQLSASLGVSQALLGILVIGLGTILPELATSIVSIKRGHGALAFGNIVGSCVLDALLIPGIGAAIASGFTLGPSILRYDLPAACLAVALVLGVIAGKVRLGRREGAFLIGIYLLFFAARAFLGIV